MEPCDCPDCTGDGFDPRAAADAILASLGEVTDAVEAEVVGSLFLMIGGMLGGDFDQAALEEFLTVFEQAASAPAAGMLAVLGTLGAEPVAAATTAGLARLRHKGVQAPGWARELSTPVAASGCVAVCDPDGDTLVLAARFDRADSAHAVMLLVDPEDCGAAAEILLMDAEDLPQALTELHRNARRDRVELTETALAPDEFRWRAESAMDVHDDHDRDEQEGFDQDGADILLDATIVDEQDGPGYRALAPLLRARLRALPLSPKPKPPHPQSDTLDPVDLLAAIQQLAASTPFGDPLGGARGRGALPTGPKLPAKRKTRDGQAPILQLRVDLRGTKPPIWRRLHVPADITLAALHDALQAAFDWDDYHMHVFDTDYGRFGTADAELGFRSDQKTTLEQVTASPGAKITYTYDFGDNWELLIAVEKTLPRDPATTYPRATAGRRAAPPEDCGGVYGYLDLLDILADPAHDEHDERLEWLGLDHPDQYDPAAFDLDHINKNLAAHAI